MRDGTSVFFDGEYPGTPCQHLLHFFRTDDLPYAVIEADGGKKPGSKVGNWIKENASKVITGGVKIGAKVGAEILTAWLKQYYGL